MGRRQKHCNNATEQTTQTALPIKLEQDSIIEHLNESTCLDSLTMLTQGIVETLGFSDFSFLRINRNWYTGEPFGLLTSLPDEFIAPYSNERLFESDMVLSYCRDNIQPVFASEIYDYIDKAPFDTALTRSNRTIIKTYKRFGYVDQYILPITASNGYGNVMLSLLDKNTRKKTFRENVMKTGAQCRLLCKALDQITTNRFQEQFISSNERLSELNGKSLEALILLIRHDNRISEIAKQMHISPITASQHIAKARRCLGVKTNVAAVVKAFELGIIGFNK